MSMFFCADCDELRDADDGCDEAAPGSLDLICVDCMEAREDTDALIADTASPAHGRSQTEDEQS